MLSDLCVRSKAVWGYDESFMALAHDALQVSVESLESEVRARYLDLAVFPEELVEEAAPGRVGEGPEHRVHARENR